MASSRQIHIRPSAGVWTARAGGALIAESERALELIEGSYPPVLYFPREDTALALLQQSETVTLCPHKGHATYFDIVTPAGRIADAVWSYERPRLPMGAIAGLVAFYPDKVSLSQR
ncbi:MAG: DUF427 domain-containing protein [Rhodobacter sp.]|nr:DUF427 domain-containing protein [Rhodobacter sp.]